MLEIIIAVATPLFGHQRIDKIFSPLDQSYSVYEGDKRLPLIVREIGIDEEESRHTNVC